METNEEKTYKILVVDDEPGIRELLFDILNFLGYQSLMASNGIEALETLARNEVDLIISDIRMPRMNGIELLKTVKERNLEIPFVLISGYKINDADRAFAEELANGFLAKPFEIEQIKALINNLLPS
jgi:DNA-binding NtrC family response regulator